VIGSGLANFGGSMLRVRVRKAKIDAKLRDEFELVGKDVVAIALGMYQMQSGGGFGHALNPTFAQRSVWFNQMAAANWLREKRDEDDRHQTVTLGLEIAITLLIVSEIAMRLLRIGA
jgi:hypothetical protein